MPEAVPDAKPPRPSASSHSELASSFMSFSRASGVLPRRLRQRAARDARDEGRHDDRSRETKTEDCIIPGTLLVGGTAGEGGSQTQDVPVVDVEERPRQHAHGRYEVVTESHAR